jgi:transcriptional regulator
MPESKSELVQGTLDLLILKTLSHGPLHGYAIARRIRQTSKDVLVVEEGSLYPALHRLEQRDWIASEWGLSEANRRAKYYELTRRGKRALEDATRDWLRVSRAIGHVLDGAAEGA